MLKVMKGFFSKMLFKNVAIEAIAYELPPHIIKSSDLENHLTQASNRSKMLPGFIEGLTGIVERRFWDPGTQPSDVATLAARKVISKAGIDPAKIGCMVSTSVGKDFIEPSVASLVHGNLNLPSGCINYDIGNACLGFLNGMSVIGMMIDKGFINYGLIVDGESSRDVVESTIAFLNRPETSPDALSKHFATLTLGSGAVAMILARKDFSTTGHILNGAVTKAATQHSRLCLGQRDYMIADAFRVLIFGVELAKKTWDLAANTFENWNDASLDLFIPHQVSQRNMNDLSDKLNLPPEKFHLNFHTLGNIGPAALPITLAQAEEEGRCHAGAHVALMGIGSGLNCSMMSVSW